MTQLRTPADKRLQQRIRQEELWSIFVQGWLAQQAESDINPADFKVAPIRLMGASAPAGIQDAILRSLALEEKYGPIMPKPRKKKRR